MPDPSGGFTIKDNLTDSDQDHFQRAIELALLAGREGNLPIGCVITLDGRVIAEGRNATEPPSKRRAARLIHHLTSCHLPAIIAPYG